MKPRVIRLLPLLALPAVSVAFSGCQVVALPDEGYTTVYGDYGYVGDWDQGPMVAEPAGYYAPPPYQPRDDIRRRADDDRRRADDDHRRDAPAPDAHRIPDRPGTQHGAAPPPHPGPGPQPPHAQRAAPEQHGPPTGQRNAPPPRAPSYNIPSIPNNPRPAPERESRDKNKR
ncbi:MAG: hypothetical protein ACHQ4G_05670 [Opitutales bacterium]